jgi:hypothetical protein
MSYVAFALVPFASQIAGLLDRGPHGQVAKLILRIAQVVTGVCTPQAALKESEVYRTTPGGASSLPPCRTIGGKPAVGVGPPWRIVDVAGID